jgi:hypothetical protein
MTYKQQIEWLQENEFYEDGSWRKSYINFEVAIWWLGEWRVNILSPGGDVALFTLPDKFDFNRLNSVIHGLNDVDNLQAAAQMAR